jgi:glycosyltransferase involved in cell wall biosynthesis
MLSITFVVTALNEEKRIGNTLETLLGVVAAHGGLDAQILVVDDGSTDATSEIVAKIAAQRPEVTLLRHERNRGIGASVQTALREARGEKFLIVPGDNDMPPSALAQLLELSPEADLVMCYFPDRGDRGKGRQILSVLFGWIYAVGFGAHVQYINGPCVYPVARLRALNLFSERFSIIPEMNVKLLRQGVSFLEVAAYRQTGLAGSTSLSLRNLRETAVALVRLGWEVHWKNRARYRSRPRRVRPNVIPPDVRGP